MKTNSTSHITFGKDRLHQISEIQKWCQGEIGPGMWTYSSPVVWTGMGTALWTIHVAFGNATYSFKEEEDYLLFVLRWA